MAKKYKYIDGVKYEVVPNYDLGSDVVAPEGGGSDLPEYSAAEAGKVLAVDSEGTGLEWSEIQGGGGSPLIVNITTQDDIVYTMDKTFSEILTAYLSSGVVFKSTTEDGYIMTDVRVIAAYMNDYGIDISDIVTFNEPSVYFSCSSENGYPTYDTGSPT